MRPLSIQRKLTLIIMAASTISLLLISVGFAGYELSRLRRTREQYVQTEADIVAAMSAAAVDFNTPDQARDTLAVLKDEKHILGAAIYKGSNPLTAMLFATYTNSASSQSFPRDSLPSVHGQSDLWAGTFSVTEPISDKTGVIGYVYLKSDLQEIRDGIARYAAEFCGLFLATLGVAYSISNRLQRIISRPIFHLAQTAQTISREKNYSFRAHKEADDEVGQLIDSFNEMVSEIQQRDAELQKARDELEQRVHERTRDLELQIAERERAETALNEQFTRTRLLNQITQIISERQDLESILYVVLRQLEDHLHIDLGIVCLFDPAAETLHIKALRLKDPSLASKLQLHEGMVFSLDHSGMKYCKQGESVVIPDTHKSPAVLAECFAGAGFRSVAGIPLMVEGKLFGTMIVARLAPDGFSSGEGEFLHSLNEHVALAAHQAQVHAELEKAYNELTRTRQTIMQQERLKALGQMASGIAHDVNNALSPIVGFADLLARSENLSPDGKKYLQYIKTAGEDIAHIVARLREFYRQRDQRETRQLLDLNNLVTQVIDMTRPRWRDIPQGRGSMIEVRTDLDPLLPELAGREAEIREALTNLIMNAVDAIPTGGLITVRTLAAGQDLESDKPTHAIIEVSDTGVGMDTETRKRCLEPFFSTKGQRGTGLGLAMVYGVMERHEGRIEVDSAPGKGTTMRLVFPIRLATGEDALERRAQAPVVPLRILCIDDEPLVRELLREILEREGHTVELADSGEAGVDAFRNSQTRGQPFEAVITDLGMPYFDGRRVTNVVKRESPSTPVIMLTGWGAFMKEDGETPAQVDGVLSKPPRSTELRDMLQRVTRNRPSMAASAQPTLADPAGAPPGA